MIVVEAGDLASTGATALVRPVASDFSPVTPAMRRFDVAAGPVVSEQCAQLGELPVGSAVITAAGELAADFIVHVAVRSRTENTTLAVVRQGLLNALRRLADWEIDDVALAPLGTGAGNLDAEESAHAMVTTLAEHLGGESRLARVVIVVEDAYQEAAFAAALARVGLAGREERLGQGS